MTGATFKRGASKQDYSTPDEWLRCAELQSGRFWSHVVKQQGCWLWDAKKDKDGYGVFSITLPRLMVGKERQKHIHAHRLAFLLSGNVLSDGMCVLHSCDNPPCCNPQHLFAGTQLDNRSDCLKKGRVARNQSHGMAKLTDEDARRIIYLKKHRVKIEAIAAEFGIGVSTAYQVGTLHWRNLT